MKKKYRLLSLMFLSLLFLVVGWGKKSVELLNDKKLIDLDAAIVMCLPGADVSDNETNFEKEEKTEAASPEVVTDDKISIEDQDKTIIIRVRERMVIYDGVEWFDMDKLEDRIRQDNGEHVLFHLIDDYAESHVYKSVVSMLSDLELEIELNYTKE